MKRINADTEGPFTCLILLGKETGSTSTDNVTSMPNDLAGKTVIGIEKIDD